MGHATRCIPIIKEFINQKFEVFLAGETAVSALLQKEFPTITILPLKGYRIQYSTRGAFFGLKILKQTPNIIKAIYYEHKWLEKVVAKYNFNYVLSDNRYGLFHKNIHCIFLTHQLHIYTGSNLLNKIVQKINYFFIKKFSQCWVMDFDGSTNLAGALSHPTHVPQLPVTYISALSRFAMQALVKSVDVLIVLSGPEPQRTIFENILLPQIEQYDGCVVLIRGLPNCNVEMPITKSNLKIINHLPAEALNNLVLKASVVVSRSGYTSIMDYAALQKKVLYVPTPGQKEQEYLAAYIAKNKYGAMCNQADFSLNNELLKINNQAFALYPTINNQALITAITKLK